MNPDWDELERIGDELTAAIDGGRLDEPTWRALWDRAVKAARGHDEFVELVANHAQPGWLERAGAAA